MKKSVVASIMISIVLTLTLAITTIATAFGGSVKPEPSVYLAYRTEDVCDELKDFKSLDLGIDFNDSASMIVYDAEKDEFTAKTAGSVSGKAVKTNGKTCDITIDVFANGDGSENSPIILANAKHLVELSEAGLSEDENVKAMLGKNYEVKANIDMAGVDFKPIGNRNVAFTGTIKGNSKTISNISINVTENNYENYLTKSVNGSNTEGFIDLGLIGNAENATIDKLNLDAMNITVAENVKSVIETRIANDAEAVEEDKLGIAKLGRVNVGGFVALAVNSTITGDENSFANVSINSFSLDNGYDAGIGGLVGVAYGVTVENYKVNTRLTVNQTAVADSVAGGVVGISMKEVERKTEISGVNVTLTGNATFHNHALIGGIVGKAYNTDIQDSVIAGIGVSGRETFAEAEAQRKLAVEAGNEAEFTKGYTKVGGVAFSLTNSTITNVSVANASVDVKGVVAGIVVENFGSVTNVAFNGNLTGVEVAGLIGYNGDATTTDAKLEFDASFAGVAVQGTLRGVRVGGVAVTNDGTINGTAGENKAVVKPIIKSVSAYIANDTEEAQAQAKLAIKESFIAGLVVENNNAVSNFNIDVALYDGLNIAGLVSKMNANSTLSNVEGNVTIMSNNLTNNVSTTYSIGGAVGFAYTGSKIENNNLVVNINKNANASRNYGAAQLGGLVARIYEDGVTVSGNTITGYMFTNYSWYNAQVGEVTDNKIILVGGLIGSMASYGTSVGSDNIPFDSHSSIKISNTKIYGNTISGFDIIVDIKLDSMENENIKIIRSLGSIIGSVNNADDSETLILSDVNNVTKIENLTIKTYRDTFTYKNYVGPGSDKNTNNCYIDCVKGLSEDEYTSNFAFGSARLEGLVSNANIQINNRKYIVE